MSKLRIGIVGCGEVTQILHLPALSQLKTDFEVTALCDVSQTVLEGVGDQWSVDLRFTDHSKLIEHPNVDAVLVANPHAYHSSVVLEAIKAGKHVLVEKPMCITLHEADAIIKAQRQYGVTVQVGYMRRYAPAFIHARELVRKLPSINLARVHDVLGKNALIIENTSNVIRGCDIPLEVKAQAETLQESLVFEAIGDTPEALRKAYLVLLGLGSHDTSAMRELLGRPKGVLYAAARHAGRYISAAFDYGDYVCQFETGIDSIPRFDGHIEVYGLEKVIRVQYDTPYIRNLPIRVYVTEIDGNGGVTEQVTHPGWGDPFVVEWKAFHKNVTERLSPKTDPSDFRQDLELFEQMIAFMR